MLGAQIVPVPDAPVPEASARPRRRRALIGALIAVVVTVAGLVVGYELTGPRLRNLDNDVGAYVPAEPYGRVWTIGDLVVCARGGPVRIRSVSTVGAHGHLRVTAWGVHTWTATDSSRNHNLLTGQDPSPLRTAAPWMRHEPVSSGCAESDSSVTEMAVEVRADSDGPITTHGFDVVYDNGRRTRHEHVTFTFTLCPGAHGVAGCDAKA